LEVKVHYVNFIIGAVGGIIGCIIGYLFLDAWSAKMYPMVSAKCAAHEVPWNDEETCDFYPEFFKFMGHPKNG
jgi:ABC-type antimicrobial peptide transport system permease subunit